MDAKDRAQINEVVMPLCGLVLSASSSAMDIVVPHWKAHGLDVLETIEKYTKVIFHFACFPLVLIMRTVSARVSGPERDVMCNMVIGVTAQALIAKHMDDAEVQGEAFVQAFNKEFEQILAMNVGAYFKEADLEGASEKFAALVTQDLSRLLDEVDQKKAQAFVPEVVVEYARNIGPDFVRLGNEYVDVMTRV